MKAVQSRYRKGLGRRVGKFREHVGENYKRKGVILKMVGKSIFK